MAWEAGRRPSTLAPFAIWPQVAEDEHSTFSGSPAYHFLDKEAFAKLSSGEAPGRKAMLLFYGKSGSGQQSIFLSVSS